MLAAGALRDFLDHMAGVIALVALSAAVMPGLATALRGLLSPPVRSHAQRLHRAVGAVGVGALLAHIGVKVAGGRVDAATAAPGGAAATPWSAWAPSPATSSCSPSPRASGAASSRHATGSARSASSTEPPTPPGPPP
ncbi:hypothetical protein [Streptomyces europaeiscabiei]|uniref:hypothetical protein n=1 Tax=Streptomyces europaeiscabiei TaxID=146819 RepID=UPI002E25FDFD